MAEEEKDEQVIIIEDLEEEKEQKRTEEERETEEEQTENRYEEADESEEKTGAHPPKSKQNLIAVALLILLIFIAALIIFFVFHTKKQNQVLEKTKSESKIEKKAAIRKVEKKEIQKRTRYNPAVDVHFINALRFQEKGNYRAAINELKQASVDLYLSYYGIGYIYLKMGNIKKAKEYLIDRTEKYLELATENNPDYIAGYINLFRAFMANREYDKAENVLNILKNKGIDKKELDLMSSYYGFVVNKRYRQIQQLLDKYKESPLVKSLAGDMYINNGELDKALKYFNDALSIYSMGSVCYNKMLIETQKHQYKEAMKCIAKTYYMEFDKIVCKNYLSFFLFLHAHRFKAANDFLNLNKEQNQECYTHFKILPKVKSNITPKDYIKRKNINYMLAAEFLNMYLKPIKFVSKGGANEVKLGDLYEGLGLPQKAKTSYRNSAMFAEAELISQRAAKFYVNGDFKNALLYYKRALSKIDTDPLLLYNVAIMYLKNRNLDKSYSILQQLKNAYPNFPLPYFCIFIVDQLNGRHKKALKEMKNFLVKLKSLNTENKDINYAGLLASLIVGNPIDNLNEFTESEKHMFLLVKSALDDDLVFLNLEKEFAKKINIDIDTSSNLTILKYFYSHYPTNFIKRVISDYYLMIKNYEEAYRALFDIQPYTAEDYYKLGIAYLLDNYANVADNFFTKSILKGDNFYNAYMAKVILQAQKGDLKGVMYYLKLILKKERMWLNTDVFLTFDIELQ